MEKSPFYSFLHRISLLKTLLFLFCKYGQETMDAETQKKIK